MAASPITQKLQQIWDDAGWPAVLNLMAASGPVGAGFVAFLKIPVIGTLVNWGLLKFTNFLIAKDVIAIKTVILDFLSLAAQAKWSKEISILKQLNDSGGVVTAEEQAAINAALQAIGENHPGTVNA